jgi:hypothetical protein
MKVLALAVLFVSVATRILSAQPVSIGVLGGVPIIEQTDTSNSLNHDESRPYILGPSIEVRLLAGFTLEADALYQRIGNTSSFSLIDSFLGTGVAAITGETTRTRANEWEFPLLGKYYFRRNSAWQPFVGTGWAMRLAEIHESGTESIINTGAAISTFSLNNSFRSDLDVGATFAAGLRYRIGHFALQPQFRYTPWGSSSLLRRDEAAFQLGFSF